MSIDKLRRIVDKHANYKLNGTSEETIKDIENRLGVQLPISYKWLLHEYGYVGFEGFEIEGIGLNNIQVCVEKTEEWREYGLPKGYVVIFEPGTEWIYCLDTAKIYDGECPVVAWGQGSNQGDKEADNLLQFMEKQIDLYN